MKLAVLSDIHGNLAALNAVFEHLEKEAVDLFVCLGDIVGYGPRPDECLQLVASRCEICVAGNHDFAVAGKIDDENFNPVARKAVRWTRGQLSPESLSFLQNLPLTARLDNVLFAHATPFMPEDWNYVLSEEEARFQLKQIEESLVFIGHSHMPLVFSLRMGLCYPGNQILNLDGDRFVVNVGSVGQPRDADARACCVTFETTSRVLEYHRIPYDVDLTCREIRDHRLPDFLADRLKLGQ